jgi:hypothetical protein
MRGPAASANMSAEPRAHKGSQITKCDLTYTYDRAISLTCHVSIYIYTVSSASMYARRQRCSHLSRISALADGLIESRLLLYL